jgi:hypothetical protein
VRLHLGQAEADRLKEVRHHDRQDDPGDRDKRVDEERQAGDHDQRHREADGALHEPAKSVTPMATAKAQSGIKPECPEACASLSPM